MLLAGNRRQVGHQCPGLPPECITAWVISRGPCGSSFLVATAAQALSWMVLNEDRQVQLDRQPQQKSESSLKKQRTASYYRKKPTASNSLCYHNNLMSRPGIGGPDCCRQAVQHATKEWVLLARMCGSLMALCLGATLPTKGKFICLNNPQPESYCQSCSCLCNQECLGRYSMI